MFPLLMRLYSFIRKKAKVYGGRFNKLDAKSIIGKQLYQVKKFQLERNAFQAAMYHFFECYSRFCECEDPSIEKIGLIEEEIQQ